MATSAYARSGEGQPRSTTSTSWVVREPVDGRPGLGVAVDVTAEDQDRAWPEGVEVERVAGVDDHLGTVAEVGPPRHDADGDVRPVLEPDDGEAAGRPPTPVERRAGRGRRCPRGRRRRGARPGTTSGDRVRHPRRGQRFGHGVDPPDGLRDAPGGQGPVVDRRPDGPDDRLDLLVGVVVAQAQQVAAGGQRADRALRQSARARRPGHVERVGDEHAREAELLAQQPGGDRAG